MGERTSRWQVGNGKRGREYAKSDALSNYSAAYSRKKEKKGNTRTGVSQTRRISVSLSESRKRVAKYFLAPRLA